MFFRASIIPITSPSNFYITVVYYIFLQLNCPNRSNGSKHNNDFAQFQHSNRTDERVLKLHFWTGQAVGTSIIDGIYRALFYSVVGTRCTRNIKRATVQIISYSDNTNCYIMIYNRRRIGRLKHWRNRGRCLRL